MPPRKAKLIIRPLEVETALSLTVDEELEVLVNADGRTVRLHFDSPRTALRLARRTTDRRSRPFWMARLQRATGQADLAVEFVVAQRVVAELTDTSRVGLLSRMFGLGPVTLRPSNVILCILGM